MTMALSGLRDFNAKMPVWVNSFPQKRNAFLRYGSPNVFFEYSPHFTLMAKHFPSNDEATAIQSEIRELIQARSFPEVTVQSGVIAIGEVNEYGQITKEIARFSLPSNMVK